MNKQIIFIMLVIIASIGGLFFLLASPSPVFAHAFGQQYILPVPFSLYACGSVFVLLVSFILLGFFLGQTDKKFTDSRIVLPDRISGFLQSNRYLHAAL